MKHGNTFFLQLSREIFADKHKRLSQNAKWLFVVMNELEQRFTGEREDFFFRSNDDLARDCNWSLPTLKKAKRELLATDLVQSFYIHFENRETRKKSEKKVCAYRIKK